MCYSAQIWADYRTYIERLDATMSIEDFTDLWLLDAGKRPKTPRALDASFRDGGPAEITTLIREWDARELTDLEQELFKQARRVADAGRSLKVKETKKALNDLRVGGNKVDSIKRNIAGLKRTASTAADSRIFPGVYAPVLVWEDGRRMLKPMRYQCRPAGKPASYDERYPGTYNARRDSLEGFWKGQFGHTHALMVADRFYENVEGEDGKNMRLEFVPQTGEPMLIACLWSHWTDPNGAAPDLLSFAAITDEPEPEVAAAGHDRTIINIKPEHVDAWLRPEEHSLIDMQAIFDDKRHPYYEHRKAA